MRAASAPPPPLLVLLLLVSHCALAAAGELTYLRVLQPPSVAFTYGVMIAKDFGSPLSVQHSAIQLVHLEPAEGCFTADNDVAGKVCL